MRLDQFQVGDKVYCVTEDGSDPTAHSTIRYIGPQFVVLFPSRPGADEFIVRETASQYGDFRKYESVEDLRRQVRELRVAGFDLFTGIRDAQWTNQGKPALHGPTPRMRDASNAWNAVTGDK